MADLFNIMKITVGADKLNARVLVNPGMPVRTSEDIEATARVYYLAPAIAMHTCLGDAGEHFQDCMSDTAVAPLPAHPTAATPTATGPAGDLDALSSIRMTRACSISSSLAWTMPLPWAPCLLQRL